MLSPPEVHEHEEIRLKTWMRGRALALTLLVVAACDTGGGEPIVASAGGHEFTVEEVGALNFGSMNRE